MDRVKIAGELVKLAKELMADSQRREVDKSISVALKSVEQALEDASRYGFSRLYDELMGIRGRLHKIL